VVIIGKPLFIAALKLERRRVARARDTRARRGRAGSSQRGLPRIAGRGAPSPLCPASLIGGPLLRGRRERCSEGVIARSGSRTFREFYDAGASRCVSARREGTASGEGGGSDRTGPRRTRFEGSLNSSATDMPALKSRATFSREIRPRSRIDIGARRPSPSPT